MFKPQAQTRSQLPVSCASPPSPSPTWRASTPCRGSRGCGEEHLVASYLRVWLIRKWTSWAKSPLETMMEGLETGLSSTRGGETELIMLGETQLSSSGSGLVSTLARLSAWASSWWTRWSDQAGKQSILYLEVVFREELVNVHHKEIILVELGLYGLLPEFGP